MPTLPKWPTLSEDKYITGFPLRRQTFLMFEFKTQCSIPNMRSKLKLSSRGTVLDYEELLWRNLAQSQLLEERSVSLAHDVCSSDFRPSAGATQDHSAQAGPFFQLGAIGAIPPGQSIVDGGSIPYKPEALAKRNQNFANRLKLDPEKK